ncbi:MAG: hypothetical protein A2Y87_09425 [Bacteroidetes bacterium RBG_13_46_8]|nr:MAG: hypothetical protein A2Y87_09425 [Bacteroidetes bacterium RBG_13_46_8]
MIQRIQSVYLFLVTVFMSLMIFLPLALLGLRDGQSVVFYSYGVKKYITPENAVIITRTLPIILLICITGLISFLNVFQFGRRVIQMRICLLNIFLLAVLLLLVLFYYHTVKGSLPVEDHFMKLPGIFPAVGIILTFLAYRNIHEDEILVQSYDRLR